MRRVVLTSFAWIVALAWVPPAFAQPRVEVEAVGRTEADGEDADCFITLRMRNAGSARLLVFQAEMEARDTRSGEAVAVSPMAFGLTGLDPRASGESGPHGALGLRCEHVRLRIRSVTCATGCAAPSWRHSGLGGIEPPR